MLFLLVVLVAWVGAEYRNKSKKYEQPERKVVNCSICGHHYIIDRDMAIARCPRCKSLQETETEHKVES